MSVLLIAGTADERTRCSTLLDALGKQLRTRLDDRLTYVDRLHLRNLSPQALLLGDLGHPTLMRARQQLTVARALVVVTPVIHGSYSGGLKLLLDLLPAAALRDKIVLPVGVAADSDSLRALENTWPQVFRSLHARQVLPQVGVLEHELPADPEHVYRITDLPRARLDKAVLALKHALQAPPQTRLRALSGFQPILIEPTLLSV